MSSAQEKRTVARGLAAIGVPGRVADHVGLGLDDAPGEPPRRVIVHERLADQKPRELDSVIRQFGAAKTSHRCKREGGGAAERRLRCTARRS